MRMIQLKIYKYYHSKAMLINPVTMKPTDEIIISMHEFDKSEDIRTMNDYLHNLKSVDPNDQQSLDKVVKTLIAQFKKPFKSHVINNVCDNTIFFSIFKYQYIIIDTRDTINL